MIFEQDDNFEHLKNSLSGSYKSLELKFNNYYMQTVPQDEQITSEMSKELDMSNKSNISHKSNISSQTSILNKSCQKSLSNKSTKSNTNQGVIKENNVHFLLEHFLKLKRYYSEEISTEKLLKVAKLSLEITSDSTSNNNSTTPVFSCDFESLTATSKEIKFQNFLYKFSLISNLDSNSEQNKHMLKMEKYELVGSNKIFVFKNDIKCDDILVEDYRYHLFCEKNRKYKLNVYSVGSKNNLFIF